MSAPSSPYVLVTGATGFIGAHVVDNLLERGIRVRAATRNLQKGELLRQARPKFASQLDIVQVGDFTQQASFKNAVKDVDNVIHVASPFSYDVKSNEEDLVKPAIAGVQAILEAASSNHRIKRVVITSSFASVLDANRKTPPRFTYTAADWNPLSYEESVDPATSAVIAYRGSKLFAEKAAWDFVKGQKPTFDIVTLCPPMTFGPIRHPVSNLAGLNESNKMLWNVASGEPLPVARVPFWIDVRDLAQAHVEALLRPEAGNKRYTVSAPEKFSYQLVADIVEEEFPWGAERIAKVKERQKIIDDYDLDGEVARKELGLEYKTFKQTVTDFITQALELEKRNS